MKIRSAHAGLIIPWSRQLYFCSEEKLGSKEAHTSCLDLTVILYVLI